MAQEHDDLYLLINPNIHLHYTDPCRLHENALDAHQDHHQQKTFVALNSPTITKKSLVKVLVTDTYYYSCSNMGNLG
jgi:hypothetical protein